MCGFAGVVSWEQRHRVERTMLGRMSACIAHRGPDGAGEFVNHESEITVANPQCGLVHRRLAILDLNERAIQPFDDGEKKRWLIFNGEIYNYRELRAEIASALPNYTWRTTCDTEVLLMAYVAWGESCVEKLRGMFAFAIWDESEKSLFLARDRMGQKPLYYAAIDATDKKWNHESPLAAIAIASELSALRAAPWMDSSINDAALADYLRFSCVPAPGTIYNGAWKLPPATWMKISPAGVKVQRYYDPNLPADRAVLDDEQARWRTGELVMRSVKEQLVSDVPVGCFLSGGIDSSIIAAAMKAAAPADQPVMTFAIGFEDARYDETKFAAEVAAHLGTTHQQFIVRPNVVDDLPKLARVFGEPFGDSSALPTHYLSRETRKHVKVALSGDGGDELFGGYDRYRALTIGQTVANLPRPLRELMGASIWQTLPGTHPKSKLNRLKRLLATLGQSAGQRYETFVRLFDEQMIACLLPAHRAMDRVIDFERMFDEFAAKRDVVRAATAIDRITYLPDDLLVKLDRASMLHALEVRSPFMDHGLVSFAAGLSTDQLFAGGGKRMLREAFAADLPATVFQRQKMGFAVPIGQWLRNELAGFLRGLLFAADSFAVKNFDMGFVRKLVEDHHASRADHSQRLYALLMLELWWRESREEELWL